VIFGGMRSGEDRDHNRYCISSSKAYISNFDDLFLKTRKKGQGLVVGDVKMKNRQSGTERGYCQRNFF